MGEERFDATGSVSPFESTSLETTTLVCRLAENSDKFDNVLDMILILQQQLVKLFHSSSVGTDSSKTAASLASKDEERLLIVRAVRALHTVGAAHHGKYFQSNSYHTNAAFFIQEMLGALTGDRRDWYHQLQVESLSACVAVVKASGCENVRLCLPGIVSACTKYLVRARQGVDAVDTRVGAVELLRLSLTTSLATCEANERWFTESIDPLSRSMGHLFAPKELIATEMAFPVVKALLQLVVEVLSLPAITSSASSPLVQVLLVACFQLQNLAHLSGERVIDDTSCFPRSLLKDEGIVNMLRMQLLHLHKIELLHFSSALLRCEETRFIFFSDAAQFNRVINHCVLTVGTEMDVEDFCGSRTHTSRICSVVDEFIHCVASSIGMVVEGPTRLEAFMDDCDTTLADWDLYALHVPTIYVLTRLVVWQFNANLCSSANGPIVCGGGARGEGHRVEELILSGAFEHLWSVVAKPHLWNITEDEELCTRRQLQHRHVVAATLLRFLEITVQTFYAVGGNRNIMQKRAVRRLTVLVLYLVLEKAVIAGIVHDTAMRVIESFSKAAGLSDALSFFLESSSLIADEAARAVTEEELRTAAANVLHGGISFIRERLPVASHKRSVGCVSEQRRLIQAIVDISPIIDVPVEVVAKVADFVASCVKVANDGCRRATLQEDASGARAAVSVLTSCFELSAMLNRSVPQCGFDEDQDSMTTSSEPRVKILQIAVLEAMQMLMSYCARNDAVAPYAIRAVVCGLTVFLTTPEAAGWQRDGDSIGSKDPPPVFSWEKDGSAPVLVRSHLRTVYKAYLAFMAILTEPVATVSTPNLMRQRSAPERRALESVRPKPGVMAALGGLEALFSLSKDFLSRRMVEEVLPLVLTWYERSLIPRIPTATDEKLKAGTKRFIEGLCHIDPSITEELRTACSRLLPPHFLAGLLT
uniref:Uncharacterized protein TCIL3000_11_4570 n=1 Tax=Trypanosoma congolense (strain IL3000) TaxID=1068625 RepID=G0V082_TRYCI|nr:unnamed protein product [Trypanosoma congolense IL3000]